MGERGEPVPITFNNPYAWRAAYVLVDYDALVRPGIKIQNSGLMLAAEVKRINSLTESSLRSLYHFVADWKELAITRDDVRQNTARAQQARAVLCEDLPQAVLDGTWRDAYAPPLKNVRASTKSQGGCLKSSE